MMWLIPVRNEILRMKVPFPIHGMMIHHYWLVM